MMDKLVALSKIPEVLQKGKMVLDPCKLKAQQVTANMIAAFLAAVLGLVKIFFGVDFGLSEEDLLTVGTSFLTIYGLYNGYVTVASTDKIGLPRK